MEIFYLFSIFLLLIKYIKTEDNNDTKSFTILKSDKDFIKPMIKLNAEFELIKMQNGLTGLLINDPYTTKSYFHFQVENGCVTDSISSLSHLAEHMILKGSEIYKDYYPLLKEIGGMYQYSSGAITGQTNQEFYFSIPYNYKFDKALKIIVDAFRYPLFLEETIKKEIQIINSEFYFTFNKYYHLLDAIIRQLCSNKTSFYGFSSGNNITLNPYNSSQLSKKLKAYHKTINRPENIFFILHSNQTIKKLEQYAEKYLNYKMYEFPENEIDKLEGKKIVENLESLKKFEIFDENLYQHGIYYNSQLKKNYLNILFYIGAINFKDLQFNLIEYYSYLFKSESLLNILKDKNYILSINNIEVESAVLIPNNNVFSINIELSEEGINNIKEILVIIYKYIEIMKKEGYKKEYFNNFIKYRQNQNNKDFQKEMINQNSFYSEIIENYRIFGENQILNFGAPINNNYNENKLKNLLDKIKIDKSFFIVNAIQKVEGISTFLENPQINKLKYYNKNYLYGKIPKDLQGENNIDNLSMRKINPYFSEKSEKDIPCYKQKINKCKELNEFDYELEDKYKGTLLNDDKNYIIYYQIDKSSETYIVNLYIDFKFIENENITSVIIDIIFFYINDILSEINEVQTISIENFDQSSISFKIQCFSDNIITIFKDFIELIKKEPEEKLFNYSKMSIKSEAEAKRNKIFSDYVFDIGNKFLRGGLEIKDKIGKIIEKIDNMNFEDFKNIYNNIFNKITYINMKIAGNFDINLVQELNDYLKINIKILPVQNDYDLETCEDNEKNEKKINVVNSQKSDSKNNTQKDLPYIITYYQKSNMPNEKDGAIIIYFKFEDKYKDYMDVLKSCLQNIFNIHLKFELSHSFNPKIYIINDNLIFYEQGRYKEPTEMEDEINQVLSEMLIGFINCDNYENIVQSYKLKNREIFEKNPENLFNRFISDDNNNINNGNIYNNKYAKIKFPKTFYKFIQQLSPIFTEPKRINILISRYDFPDYKYYLTMKHKVEKPNYYMINENIKITYTNNIRYLRNK